MVITASLNHLFVYVWELEKFVVRNHNFSKDHTYIVICSIGNKELFDKSLEKNNNIKVVFKSEQAVNKVLGHGTSPRNTLYVLEWQD